MVYDSYIGKTGNIFFSFYYFGHCKAMILVAKGKSGKEKALGTFPVLKKKSTTSDSDVWNAKGKHPPCRPGVLPFFTSLVLCCLPHSP